MSPELIREILTYANPAVTISFIVLWDRYQAKRNGLSATDVAAAVKPELLHHLDMAITDHFDQLRRDLSNTIERASDQGAKGMENAITKLLLNLEVRWRKR